MATPNHMGPLVRQCFRLVRHFLLSLEAPHPVETWSRAESAQVGGSELPACHLGSLIPAPWRQGLSSPRLCAPTLAARPAQASVFFLCTSQGWESSRASPLASLGFPALPWDLGSKEHTGAWLPAWEGVAQTNSREDGVSSPRRPSAAHGEGVEVLGPSLPTEGQESSGGHAQPSIAEEK